MERAPALFPTELVSFDLWHVTHFPASNLETYFSWEV